MNLEILKATVSLGTILAVVISWSLNKSIFWSLFHGICGWLYIIYYVLGPQNHDNLKD